MLLDVLVTALSGCNLSPACGTRIRTAAWRANSAYHETSTPASCTTPISAMPPSLFSPGWRTGMSYLTRLRASTRSLRHTCIFDGASLAPVSSHCLYPRLNLVRVTRWWRYTWLPCCYLPSLLYNLTAHTFQHTAFLAGTMLQNASPDAYATPVPISRMGPGLGGAHATHLPP